MIFLFKLEQIIFISYHLFPVVAFGLKVVRNKSTINVSSN